MSKIKKPKINKTKEANIADDFKLLSDRDHVRLRPGMYIPNKDYCVYELLDNGIDILINSKTSHLYPKKEIQAQIDKEGVVTVTDSAGALPTEESDEVPGCSVAELCMSRLKAGTKFEEGVKSSGLHGVGASCINFLSDWFNVEIYKDGKVHSMGFEKGVIKEKLHVADELQHKDFKMTLIQAHPDPEIWKDKDDYNIPAINNRIKQVCYLNPELTVKVDIDYNDHKINETYNYPEGVKSYVEELTANKNIIHDPWFLESKNIKMGTKIYKEPIYDKEDPNLIIGYDEVEKDVFMDLSVAFVYTDSYSDTIYAFTNNVINTDGKSSNITGFKRGIAAAIKECFESEYPKSKTQLTAEDTREGIVAVVSVKVPDPNYIGQGKDYLNMPTVASIIYGEIKEFMEDQFDKLPNDKDNILNKVIESNKIREAAHKAKEAARKNKTVSYGKVDGLTKCISKKPHEKYIWLVEGDSAGGSAKKARDEKVDAILPIFGKILNVYDKPIDKVLSSEKIMMIAKALECGIGEDFTLDDLAYHHVVVLTDGDADGEHIRCLYITLFYKYMRPLIEEGHLYIAQPPLFGVKVNPRTKKERIIYAWNQAEVNEICASLTEKYEIQRFKGLGEMNFEELRESTMNKDTRRLIKVTIDDAAAAEEMLSVCMCDKNIAARKQFILSNKPGGDVVE